MEVPAVNNVAVAQAARGASIQVPPPATPENDNNQNQIVAPSAENKNNENQIVAPANEDQNNQIAGNSDINQAVVVRRLTPVDIVERQNAPDIEAIPQQVNVPDPFTNIIPDGDTPLLQVQIAREQPQPPESPPANTANNEGEQTVQPLAPELSQNQVEILAPTPPAPEPPTAQPPTATPSATEPTAPAGTPPATAATQTRPNQAAQGIQQNEANGQANNNPIAEQEVGGTVNIAV